MNISVKNSFLPGLITKSVLSIERHLVAHDESNNRVLTGARKSVVLRCSCDQSAK